MGFVVGNLPTGQTTATYLVRAIGPSLRQFGIANPAPQPKLTVFNAQGQQISNLPGIPVAYDWNAVFASVGAFGLISVAQVIGGAQDAYLVVSLVPGSYTVQVTDASGKGGQLLIEAYSSPRLVIIAE